MSNTHYQFITTEADVDRMTHELSGQPLIGIDTETTGLDPFHSKVRLIQLATPEASFVVDLFRVNALSDPLLRGLLESPLVTKVFHNAKFDAKMLAHHFHIEVDGIFDTLLASQLIGGGRQDYRHGLGIVAERHLGEAVDKTMQRSDWSGHLDESQIEYAARDAEVMLPLYATMSEQLATQRLTEVARLEFDCVLPISRMELVGMALDANCWRALAAEVEAEHHVIARELKAELAEGVLQLSLFDEVEINLDSPAQVLDALQRMGIHVEGTRNSELQPLAADHRAIAKLLEYRVVQKAVSSYGLSMLEHINPITGRLHADFRQIGATGGRMSCSDPNLQQVPNTPRYRGCFKAPPGRKLIVADYSQIELRIIADWSQDIALVRALESGEDLHCATASQMFNIPLAEVTKDQRSAAKQLNYGLMYGLGPRGLAARIDCSVEEADILIHRYFTAYSGVAEWLREAAEVAVRERQNRTRSGRLIYFDYDPEDRAQIAAVERFGKNSPIQGSSADIIKRAMFLLDRALRDHDTRIVNCVHDEIVVESAADQAEECARIVEKQMAAAGHEFIRSVPVTVDFKIGDAWIK